MASCASCGSKLFQPPADAVDPTSTSPNFYGKMSFWDALTGRKSSSAPPSSSTPNSSSVTFQDSGSEFQSPAFDPSTAQDVSSFLSSPSLPDPSHLHPLAGLNQSTLDYLTLEESALSDLPGSQSALPSRGFSDDLCYGTGVTYLAALSAGGAWGLAEGLTRLPPSAPPKLRLNSVLNSITRRGPFLGNSAGVIALIYNCINSTIGYYRGKHDAANSLVAGALSGMLFKSTRGIRPMMISGALVSSAAGAWVVSLLPVEVTWSRLTNCYRLPRGPSSRVDVCGSGLARAHISSPCLPLTV